MNNLGVLIFRTNFRISSMMDLTSSIMWSMMLYLLRCGGLACLSQIGASRVYIVLFFIVSLGARGMCSTPLFRKSLGPILSNTRPFLNSSHYCIVSIVLLTWLLVGIVTRTCLLLLRGLELKHTYGMGSWLLVCRGLESSLVC